MMTFPKLMLWVVMSCMLVACSESDQVPQNKVDLNKITSKIRGYVMHTKIVATKHKQPEWVQAIATGYVEADGKKLPQKVEHLSSHGKCSFTAPAASDYIGHVYFETAEQETSIHFYSDESLIKSAKNFVYVYKKRGANEAKKSIDRPRSMKIADVFVTEKSKPVYLVLSSSGNVIWNIHKADGVKISRIALIGYRNGGIVNVDPTTPIEALHNDSLKRCNIKPARTPRPNWALVKRAESSSNIAEALEKNERQANTYFNWLIDQFGEQVADDIVETNIANHALIGDLPAQLDQRIAYNKIEGKIVRISSSDTMLVAKKKAAREEYKSRVIALATEMAGGDLTILKPSN